MKTQLWLPVVLLFYCLLTHGCGEEKNKAPTPQVPPGITHFLHEEVGRIILPKAYKKSSKYRIERDISLLQSDSLALFSFQQMLETLEFKDSELDVFVDTGSVLNLLVIADFPYTPLDKSTGVLTGQFLKKIFAEVEYETGGLVRPTKLEMSMKGGGQTVYYKFKYRLNYPDATSMYIVFYVFTTKNKSFFIYEFRADEAEIEPYLLTLRTS